jgi:hypothetical protein
MRPLVSHYISAFYDAGSRPNARDGIFVAIDGTAA